MPVFSLSFAVLRRAYPFRGSERGFLPLFLKDPFQDAAQRARRTDGDNTHSAPFGGSYFAEKHTIPSARITTASSTTRKPSGKNSDSKSPAPNASTQAPMQATLLFQGCIPLPCLSVFSICTAHGGALISKHTLILQFADRFKKALHFQSKSCMINVYITKTAQKMQGFDVKKECTT